MSFAWVATCYIWCISRLNGRRENLELCARVPHKSRSFGQTKIVLVLPGATR